MLLIATDQWISLPNHYVVVEEARAIHTQSKLWDYILLSEDFEIEYLCNFGWGEASKWITVYTSRTFTPENEAFQMYVPMLSIPDSRISIAYPISDADVHSFRASENIEFSSRISANSRIYATTGTAITFKPGFHISAGSSMMATLGYVERQNDNTSTTQSEYHAVPWGCLPLCNQSRTLFRAVQDDTSAKAVKPVEYSFNLHGASPNPFNPDMNLQYELPSGGTIYYDMPVEINIFNVSGALVRRLFHGTQSSGKHRIHWNGIANDGCQVAAGTYLIQLIADGRTMTSRCQLIR